MTFVATTISEHIRHEGELIGEERAEKRAEERVRNAEKRVRNTEKRVALDQLEELYREGLLTKEVFEAKAAPLQEALLALTSLGDL